ncbi:MAG TPA: helix-turn-helix domain-containing protein [Caulifigura sp.]|jgi:putative transcriptional regulator|nr:helix-turn-helix domain-containing protein [Caulifigura sp.]
MPKKKQPSFFEELKVGLEEGIAHLRGEMTLKTTEVSSDPPEIAPKDLTALREEAGMSQFVFARALSVSFKTIQSWEQGVRKPSPHSRRLIQLFSERPEVFCDVIGLSPVKLSGVKVVDAGRGRRKIVVRGA